MSEPEYKGRDPMIRILLHHMLCADMICEGTPYPYDEDKYLPPTSINSIYGG